MPTDHTPLAGALRDPAVPVRGLTVRQPWTAAITHLHKDVENRSRVTTYTGLLLIHAAKRPDTDALRDAPADLPGLTERGTILAVARLTGCHPHTQCNGRCSTWADPDRWHWQLTDVVALRQPVPATGALYLWTPTTDLRHLIAAALPVAPERATGNPYQRQPEQRRMKT
ncbi:hypothetical protein [Streptomyces harbinensis]|uniref:hypothetical protein n=1 Tax=Streptomyces harbinensis TaxID=1176198 RepID=UPI0034DFC71B